MNHTTTTRLKPYKKVAITCKLMSFTREKQSTRTAWVLSLTTHDVGPGQNILYPVKNIGLYHFMTLFQLVAIC